MGVLGKIVLDRDCWQECRVNPTRGGNGEDGRQGYPGYDGKRGGNSGSFYLQAFNLSDFHLTNVKKTQLDLEAKEEEEVLGDMEEKEAKTEETEKVFAPLIFPVQKEEEKDTGGIKEETAKMEKREQSVLKI